MIRVHSSRLPSGDSEHSAEASALFDAAATRLLHGNPDEATSSDLATVLDWVQRIVRRGYASVDADDIAQETLARVFALAQQKRSEPIANPPAYITRIAQHLAFDAVRQQATLTPDSDLVERAPSSGPIRAAHDEELAALLDRSATHTTVSAAIGIALQQRDFVAVRVVTVWLDLADELGREPSSREVAMKANASHTTVNKALGRFRELIQRLGH